MTEDGASGGQFWTRMYGRLRGLRQVIHSSERFAGPTGLSGRQLRFYDQLGLLRPAHVDQQTGYRYYTIRQLPRLNSILALKELGWRSSRSARCWKTRSRRPTCAACWC